MNINLDNFLDYLLTNHIKILTSLNSTIGYYIVLIIFTIKYIKM